MGREDYIAADDYAQKFGDNEHRVFALAQRRAQVSKDSSMSGAKKTATINKLDEEIKKLLEAIKEDKYGLTNKSGASGARCNQLPRQVVLMRAAQIQVVIIQATNRSFLIRSIDHK